MDSMIRQRTLMFIAHNEPTLSVGPHFSVDMIAAIIKCNGVVLWDNEGRWGLLTRIHLQNLLGQWELVQAHRRVYPRTPYAKANWSFTNTIPVPSEVARALRLNG